jgi:hypothetical protein
MSASTISLAAASKVMPNLSRIQQALKAEALHRVRDEEQKSRAEKEEKEQAAVTQIENEFHTNRKLLCAIHEKFNELVIKLKLQDITNKTMSDIITPLNNTDIWTACKYNFPASYKSICTNTIEKCVNDVNDIINKNIAAPIAPLCQTIITNIQDNICKLNFIRQLAYFTKMYHDIITQFQKSYNKTYKADYVNRTYKNINNYLLNQLNIINKYNKYTNCTVLSTKNKYLKYKFKYLKLKNQMGGGDNKELISKINNLFIESVPDPLKEAPEDKDFVKIPPFSWLLPLSSIDIDDAYKKGALDPQTDIYTLIEKVTTLINKSNAPIAKLCKEIIGQIINKLCHFNFIRYLAFLDKSGSTKYHQLLTHIKDRNPYIICDEAYIKKLHTYNNNLLSNKI